MRKYLLVACLLALGVSTVYAAEPANGNGKGVAKQQSSQIKWFTRYSEAAAAAKQEKKPMLLFFTGSDWCGWCKKMHQEVFASPEFAKEVGNNFVFVEIDFPMNKPLPTDQQQENNQLKQKYGVTGYPTIIILDASGNFVAETGYRPGGGKAYADYLKQLLK
ncbi:MAG: Disulfide bond reductase DsbH [Chlamydiales bacterium]|nr:Disulfide bond reductase DsbH [Chlamydiales bacterium]